MKFGIESEWFSLSYVYVTFADDPYDDSFWLPVADVRTHPGYNPGKYSVADGIWADANGQGRIQSDDMGVIVLAEPVDIEPARLAPLGLLDDLKRAGQLGPDTKFLAVGYGCHATLRPSTPVYEPHNRELVLSHTGVLMIAV